MPPPLPYRQAWISTGFSLRSAANQLPLRIQSSTILNQERALSSSPVMLEERDTSPPVRPSNEDSEHPPINATSSPSQPPGTTDDVSAGKSNKSKQPESLKDIFPDLFGSPEPLMARREKLYRQEKKREWEKTLEQSMTDSAAMIDPLPRPGRPSRPPAPPADISSTISSIFNMGSDPSKNPRNPADPTVTGAKAGARDRTRAAPKELQAFHELLESMFEASEAQAAEIGRQRRGISNRRENSGFGIERHGPPRDSYLSDGFAGGRRSDRLDHTAQQDHTDDRSPMTTIAKPVGNMRNVSDKDMEDYMQKRELIAAFRTDLDVLEWLNRTYYMASAPLSTFTAEEGSEAATSSSLTPSYPLVLAYAISVLHLSFRNPHAALAVFETARSHSLESYLVGCTTSVYNQMLRARWEGLGDLKGTEEGLEEMGRRGVGWDKDTMDFANTLVEKLFALRTSGDSATRTLNEQRLVWAYGPDALERHARLDEMVKNQVEFSERGVRIQMKRRVDKFRERQEGDGHRLRDYTRGDVSREEYGGPQPRWV